MKIIVVRHCQAEGQERDAPLTDKGKQQAKDLARFLDESQFDVIISSPFIRAVESIKPYAELKQKKIQTDERLAERILTIENDPDWDWRTNLKRTYKEEHLKFPGGESTFEAKERIRLFINDLQSNSYNSILAVTHGNLMSLMLNLFHPSFGFKEWELLSNPDVYEIELPNKTITKLWVS